MGNDLCQAAQESQFKIRCQQICVGAENLEGNRRPQQLSFSADNSPRTAKYHQKQNDYDENSIYKIDRVPASQEDLKELLNLKPVTNNTANSQQDSVKQQKQNQRNLAGPQNTLNEVSSPTRNVKVNLQSVYLKHMNSNQEEGNVNYNPLDVPFSVIKMLLSKKVLSFIQLDNQEFFKKLSKNAKEVSFKLYKEGYYGHIMTENFGIFLNEGFFYQGNFIKQNQIFLPHEKGTYISQKGKYKGQFSQGKPQGRGKFFQYCQKVDNFRNSIFSNQPGRFTENENNKNLKKPYFVTIYEGEWQEGQLKKGVAQNELCKYEGYFENNKPHGEGKLYFKQAETTYKGSFKNGKFDGKNSVYQTPTYTYSGDFVQGKKKGQGVLLQKMSAVKTSKGKLRAEEKYEGTWDNDRLVKVQKTTL